MFRLPAVLISFIEGDKRYPWGRGTHWAPLRPLHQARSTFNVCQFRWTNRQAAGAKVRYAKRVEYPHG